LCYRVELLFAQRLSHLFQKRSEVILFHDAVVLLALGGHGKLGLFGAMDGPFQWDGGWQSERGLARPQPSGIVRRDSPGCAVLE
jgi:hypothetical protein